MTQPKLKPCPFCGGTPILKNDGFDMCRQRENGDFITRWKVWCPNCGTEKRGGASYYWFANDETLRLADKRFDGRKQAIEAWNRRAEDGK